MICDTLHDLVPFLQFKKHEKHQCRELYFKSKSIAPVWVIFKIFKIVQVVLNGAKRFILSSLVKKFLHINLEDDL